MNIIIEKTNFLSSKLLNILGIEVSTNNLIKADAAVLTFVVVIVIVVIVLTLKLLLTKNKAGEQSASSSIVTSNTGEQIMQQESVVQSSVNPVTQSVTPVDQTIGTNVNPTTSDTSVPHAAADTSSSTAQVPQVETTTHNPMS